MPPVATGLIQDQASIKLKMELHPNQAKNRIALNQIKIHANFSSLIVEVQKKYCGTCAPTYPQVRKRFSLCMK